MVSAAAIDVIGYIGGYVVALASPFQLLKGLRTWSTKDISWLWVTQFLTGLILLFSYGILADLPVIYIPITLEIFCSASILCLKTWIEVIEGKEYANDVQCQTASVVDADADGGGGDTEEKVLYSRLWKPAGGEDNTEAAEEERKEDTLMLRKI